MQRLQRIRDSRGGEFDGEIRERMILGELESVRQDMEGVWGDEEVMVAESGHDAGNR